MNTIDPSGLMVQLRALATRAEGTQGIAGNSTVKQSDFQGMLTKALASVNQTQQQAASLSARFEHNDPKVDLSEVMIASQKANVSFQAITQVRNKLVSAYQDIMNMPI